MTYRCKTKELFGGGRGKEGGVQGHFVFVVGCGVRHPGGDLVPFGPNRSPTAAQIFSPVGFQLVCYYTPFFGGGHILLFFALFHFFLLTLHASTISTQTAPYPQGEAKCETTPPASRARNTVCCVLTRAVTITSSYSRLFGFLTFAYICVCVCVCLCQHLLGACVPKSLSPPPRLFLARGLVLTTS